MKLHCLYDDKEQLATQLVRCLLAFTTRSATSFVERLLGICVLFSAHLSCGAFSRVLSVLSGGGATGLFPAVWDTVDQGVRRFERQAQSARKPGEKSFRTTRKAGRPKPAGSLPMILGIDNSPRQLRAAEQLRLPSIVQRDGAQIKKSRPGLPLPCSACKIVQNLRTAPSISIAGLQMGG